MSFTIFCLGRKLKIRVLRKFLVSRKWQAKHIHAIPFQKKAWEERDILKNAWRNA
ncbi:MAG: hypothetical protein QW304_00645 [Thermoproteota archaeon]